MSKKQLDSDSNNFDIRLTRVEQILPTLPTKTDLATTIAPLATKVELAAAIAPLATRAELAAAIAPLATKAELAAAIAPLATKAELAEGLNGLRILIESGKDDTRMLTDSVLSLHRKFDRLAEP